MHIALGLINSWEVLRLNSFRQISGHMSNTAPSLNFLTYRVRPHQPIIDQQGIGLRGQDHKEAHPVIPDLH